MNTENKTAVWVLTQGGLSISRQLKQKKEGFVFFVSKRFDDRICDVSFTSLNDCVKENFNRYPRHLFIMATGIVIRVIAGHLRHKTVDPAVVSMDDAGRYVICLLSGHIGGANRLTLEIADLTGAEPVLSTATDINKVPAIDMIARQKGLRIENPEMIKTINMAFLEKEKIWFQDPLDLVADFLDRLPDHFSSKTRACEYRVIIDDRVDQNDDPGLILRPPTLCVGVGCNRGTPASEIMDFLKDLFNQKALSVLSIRNMATIDIKKEEKGILDVAESLNVPVVFFENRELESVQKVKNISQIVKKYTGAKSVCEAAAILAAENGELIVEKHKTKNVTLAVARMTDPCISSV